MINIIEYGLNSRDWFKKIEKIFYSELAPNLKPKYENCFHFLGKSISYFIYKNNSNPYLVLFDLDDGTGLLETSCKINYENLYNFIEKNGIKDFIIFKAQLNRRDPVDYRFYKDIDKTYPLGYFPTNIKKLLKLKSRIKFRKVCSSKQIDILWIGSIVPENCEGLVWPKGLSLKYWDYGKRIAAFKVVSQIAEERRDLNIVCSNNPIPFKKYLKKISKTKICFDFPGVGQLTRRFFECLLLEKCVMGFEKRIELPYELKEDYHFLSIKSEENDIRYDYDVLPNENYPRSNTLLNIKIEPTKFLYHKIMAKIDSSINSLELIEEIEKHVKEIQPYLHPKYLITYIPNTIKNFLENKNMMT